MGVASAMLGGAAISGIAGAASNMASNSANKGIAQMNNAFNEKMMQKQMDYNSQMYERQLGDTWAFYNDQKEYNSLQSKMQQAREAGVNPALALGSGAFGSVSSPSAPSAQGVTPPTASQYQADYSGIGRSVGDAINLYNQLKNSQSSRGVSDAESYNMRIEGQYKAAQAMADLVLKKSQAKSIDAKTDIDKIIKSFLPRMYEADLDMKTSQAENIKMTTKIANIEYLMSQQKLNFLPAQLKLQLGLDAANIQLLKARGRLTDAQVETEINRAANVVADTYLKREQKNQTRGQNTLFYQTYKQRVQMIKEELHNLVYDTDKLGIFNTSSKFLRALGVPTGY